MANKILNKKQLFKAIDKNLKETKKIEQICRKICELQNINPEKLVCKMMPELINYPYTGGFFLPNPQHTMPAWMMYIDVVKLTIEAMKND